MAESRSRIHRKLAILTGVLSVVVAASAAHAQDSDRERAMGYGNPSTETIEVYGPRLRVERSPMNGPVKKISFSRLVRFDDLDLRTPSGARELRLRVRDTAHDICAQLAAAYPIPEASGTSCYRTALQDAELRADAAISDARSY